MKNKRYQHDDPTIHSTINNNIFDDLESIESKNIYERQ